MTSREKRAVLKALKTFIKSPNRKTFKEIVYSTATADCVGCLLQEIRNTNNCAGCPYYEEDSDNPCWIADYEEGDSAELKGFWKMFDSEKASFVLKTIEMLGVIKAHHNTCQQ